MASPPGRAVTREETTHVTDAAIAALIGAIGLLINAAGLAFVATQVVLARRQLQHGQQIRDDEILRGKRQATIDFYMGSVEQRRYWASVLPDVMNAPAVAEFIEAAFESDDTVKHQHISDYLSFFEALAVAVAGDVYDLEILDSMGGTVIRKTAANYRPYFERLRQIHNAPAFYTELEWLGRQLEELNGDSSAYVLLAQRNRAIAS